MILVYLLCLILAAGMACFVGIPLIRSGNRPWEGRSLAGFADEEDLRATLALRDALVERCLGRPAGHPVAQSLDPAAAEDALLLVCQRLHRASLPLFPKAARTSADPQSGSGRVGGLFLSFAAALALWAALARAQPLAPGAAENPHADPKNQGSGQSQAGSQAGAAPRIPYPDALEGDVYLSRVHQFLLSPRQGNLRLYYTTVFSAPPGASSVKIAVPAPEGFGEVELPRDSAAHLVESVRGVPVFEVPAKASGATDFRVELSIPAAGGTARIHNSVLGRLPGLVIFLLPEQDGTLRSLLEPLFGMGVNVWPARVSSIPAGFQSERQQDEADPMDPNFALFQKLPPQFTRQLVRMPNPDRSVPEPYPDFEVAGIVPSRAPLIALSVAVAAMLLGIALVTTFRARSNALLPRTN